MAVITVQQLVQHQLVQLVQLYRSWYMCYDFRRYHVDVPGTCTCTYSCRYLYMYLYMYLYLYMYRAGHTVNLVTARCC